jgi:hypothetical protein
MAFEARPDDGIAADFQHCGDQQKERRDPGLHDSPNEGVLRCRELI